MGDVLSLDYILHPRYHVVNRQFLPYYAGVEYMTIREVADRLGVSKQAIRRYVADGRLKAEPVLGRFWLIPKEDAERFIAEYKPRQRGAGE